MSSLQEYFLPMSVLSKVGLSVKNLLVMANEAVLLGINTCDMLTVQETYKPVSFQTKFDFMAWLQGEHISVVLASEATHRSAMVSRILSQHCSVSKREAKAQHLPITGKLLTLSLTSVFSKVTECFLALTFSLLHRHSRNENISTHS